MLAYKQQIIIENPQHTVLSNLPFKAGQRVEVLILLKEDAIEKIPPSSNKSNQPLAPHEETFSKQTLSDSNQVINPAQAYTDTEWEKNPICVAN
jgi:hypothetical protein